MKECFHFTKNKYLKSILENGLQPTFGTNCSIIGDRVGAKVSYSVGSDEATVMFRGVYDKYCRIADGRVNLEGYDENGRKAIEELQQAKDFEDWEGEGIYLMFDGEQIDEAHRDETKLCDSYTDMPISPEKLKVCTIRNKETGEVISSKYDVASYWMARSEKEIVSFFAMEYGDKIEKYKSDVYEMEYVEFERFCELHPEILGEEIERKGSSDMLPEVIDESKFGKKIAELFGRIKDKIKSALYKGEAFKQKIEEKSPEVDESVANPDQGNSFMDKLINESKTIEEAAVEIVTEEENMRETKAVEPQTPEEI